MTWRLCVAALLLAALALTATRYPAIFSGETAPVPEGELWRLNQG